MKIGLPSMKNVLMPISKSVLILLGLTAAASGKMELFKRKFMDQESLHRSGLLIKVSGLFIKGVSGTNENETKEQKGESLSNLNESKES